MVFKEGGKLKATVKWRITWQNNVVVDKFIYLTVTLESEEVAINKTTKEYQALVPTDMYVNSPQYKDTDVGRYI